jgi:integrase
VSVYKRFNGKKVLRGSPDYNKGTWYYRFKVRGRLFHQSIPEAQTAEEAKRAESSIKQKLFNNKFDPTANRVLFSEFVDTVYLPYAEQKNKSIATKKIHARNLKDFFGKTYLRDIVPNGVRLYQSFRLKAKKKNGKPLSPASVNRELTTLSKIFTLALQDELVDRNPCSMVEKLKESKPRDRLLSKEEEKRFWNEVNKDKQLTQIVLLAINTGLRKGQILAIKVSDIDFEKGRLNVIASKGRDERQIPLNQKALDVLKEASKDKTDFIFNGSKTKRRLGDFKKKWYKCLKEAKLSDFRFHDLRHIFASNLMRSNVHPVIVKDLLGHGEIKMSERYMNTDFDLLSEAVNRLQGSNREPSEKTDDVLDSDVIIDNTDS